MLRKNAISPSRWRSNVTCGWCVVRTASSKLRIEPSAPKTLVHDLQRKLTGWTGKRWIVVVSKEQGAPTMRAQAEAQQAEIERDVQSDPLVQAVLNRFPGAKVVGVTTECTGRRGQRMRLAGW